MPFKLILHDDNLEDLAVLRDLGAESIKLIIDKIKKLSPPPLKPLDLHRALKEILPERTTEIEIIFRPLMFLYNLRRKRNISVEELIDGLSYSITLAKNRWDEDKISEWNKLKPLFQELFSLPEIWTVVKALDLAYDYTNLLRNIKILTDIRPVYNEEATEILGAVVSNTLRLYYDSSEGTISLSIALDEEDVENLLDSCTRALEKAKTAQRFMREKGDIDTFLCGEEVY